MGTNSIIHLIIIDTIGVTACGINLDLDNWPPGVSLYLDEVTCTKCLDFAKRGRELLAESRRRPVVIM